MAASVIAQPIGLSIAGPVSESLGIRSWFVLGSVVMLIMSFWEFINPVVMELEKTVIEANNQS